MQTPFASVLQDKLVEGGKRKQVKNLRTVVRAAKEAGSQRKKRDIGLANSIVRHAGVCGSPSVVLSVFV